MAANISIRDAKEAVRKYLPYGGVIGYSVLSLHSVNVHVEEVLLGKGARIVVFHSALVLSSVGIGTYLYNRRVFTVMRASKAKHLLWSVFGTWMFNLGSLLFWAICKEICPKNKLIRAIAVLSSSAGLLFTGNDYLNAVDSLREGIIAEREEDIRE